MTGILALCFGIAVLFGIGRWIDSILVRRRHADKIRHIESAAVRGWEYSDGIHYICSLCDGGEEDDARTPAEVKHTSDCPLGATG